MAMQKLVELRGELADARAKCDELSARVEELLKELQQIPEWVAYQAAISSKKAWKDAANQAYKALGSLAVRMFEDSGAKMLADGVAVKEFIVVEYDSEEALEYCIENLRAAVQLDKRAFERAAKAIDIPVATLVKEPRPSIAGDLSEFVTLE